MGRECVCFFSVSLPDNIQDVQLGLTFRQIVGTFLVYTYPKLCIGYIFVGTSTYKGFHRHPRQLPHLV